MPTVPFASPQAQAQREQPDQTFMAMALAEFVAAHRQSPGTAQAPNKGEADAPTDS